MLALAVYYFFDAAKEDDWEPLLAILDEVNATLAGVHPVPDQAAEDLERLRQGLEQDDRPVRRGRRRDRRRPDRWHPRASSRRRPAELLDAIETVGVQELTTFADIWGAMNTCHRQGLVGGFVPLERHDALPPHVGHLPGARAPGGGACATAPSEGEERFEQFLAFALGYIMHVGTDTIAHSFVNEQCGGPYRDHPTRHHLIENHIDAWNYAQSGAGRHDPRPTRGARPTTTRSCRRPRCGSRSS